MTHSKSAKLEHLKESASSLKYIQDNTESEKINILYSHLAFSIFGSFACSSVIFFSLNAPISLSIKCWYIAVILISILRAALVFAHKHIPNRPKLFHWLFILGVVISASCWGAIDSLLMPKNDLMQQMIIITVVAGVSAGAMQTLQSCLTSSILYLLLTIFPLFLWTINQHTFEYYALSVAITIYIGFCGITAFRGNRLINQVLKLNFKNLDLVCRLYKSNDELTIKNIQLERHEKDMKLINQMNKKLQLCKSSDETYLVIKKAAEELFTEFNGGLMLTNSSGKQELVAHWGSQPSLQSNFPSTHCWGIQNKNQYIVTTSGEDKLCNHYTTSPIGSCCIPLIVDNNLLGCINFNFSSQVILTNYIKQFLAVFADAVQLALAKIQLEEKLQLEATHDPLTNLFNRRYLNEVLSRELHRVSREKVSLCLVMLDLDYFKSFNDTYGHEAGDVILKFMSTILTSHLRGTDIACRFGGEEFVLVFVNTTIEKLMPYLENLREEIEKSQIIYLNERLRVTVSIGVAQAPEHGTTVDDLIRAADTALYSAKKSGRNNIKITQSVIPFKGAH